MEIPDWKPAGRRYLLLFLLLALALGGAGWYVLQETPEPELVLTVEETGGEHREQAGASVLCACILLSRKISIYGNNHV